MSYKPDEKEWMAYLYGELDEGQQRKFDQYIIQNPAARAELERLQNLRGLMSEVRDKEIIAPPIVIGENTTPAAAQRRYLWNTSYFRAIASIAASLVLIIIAAKLTGMQMTISDHEMRLSFGQAPQRPTPEVNVSSRLTEEQVQQMITASLQQNNSEIQANLEETQKKLDASIRKNLALSSGRIDHLVREASLASEEQIRHFVNGIRTENMQQVKDYFQLTSTEQKKYIENLLVDFAKYLQQQRNDDLKLVQTRMNSLEQNTDLFKQETEQILSSIITTVGTPVSGETKN